jgi:hypothetical protein
MDYKYYNTEKELIKYLRTYFEIKNYSKLDSVLKNIEDLLSESNCTFCYYAILKKLSIFRMRVYASSKLILIFKKKAFVYSIKVQKHNITLNKRAKAIQLKRKFRNRFRVGKFGPHQATSNTLIHGRGLSAPMQF